jgi:two-component system sensor histidine kinase ComP
MEQPTVQDNPKIITLFTRTGFLLVFAFITVSLIIFYNVGYYIYVPLTGVWLDYANPEHSSSAISSLDPGGPGEIAGLMVGDQIITIDGRAITDLNIPIHQLKKPGDNEVYVVNRGGRILTIPIQVGNYLFHLDFLIDILPLQLISILVGLVGLVLLFFSSQSDVRSRLIALALALAGVALAATGPGYTGCIWLAPQVAMLTFAISIFIMTSAHLYFPVASFSRHIRNLIIWILFCLSLVLSMIYIGQEVFFAIHKQYLITSLSAQVIMILFYISMVASIGLLLKNRFLVKDREIKRQTGIIFMGTLISLLPFLFLSGLPALLFGRDSAYVLLPSDISILTIIFLPISYGYVIYQHRLLKIDLMINRVLVLFLLLLITLFFSFIILSVISILFHLPAPMAVAGSLVCVLFTLPSASMQKGIKMQVDRILYGGYYDYTTVTSDLSNSLVQAIDRPSFVKLLTYDLPKKMKITKSALLLLSEDELALQDTEASGNKIQFSDPICQTLTTMQQPKFAQNLWHISDDDALEDWKSFFWTQLFVPIVHQDMLYGLLILGDRVNGDIYSNQDLQILATVSQQAALSIANIFLIERLRGLAQQLVRSDEEQRKRLATDLHDTVLQNLIFVKQRLPKSDPELIALVDDSLRMIQQTIKAQRSSLLDRGLMFALQDMINYLQKLADEEIVILWHNNLDGGIALSDEKATQLYRIVHESLINVLKHSHAEKAVVSARKVDGFLELKIEDDGVGMASETDVYLGHHYGLIGMQERASMIGAEMSINSQPGSGTVVLVKVKL